MPSVLQLLLFTFPFPKLKGRRHSCRYSDAACVQVFKSVEQSEDPVPPETGSLSTCSLWDASGC